MTDRYLLIRIAGVLFIVATYLCYWNFLSMEQPLVKTVYSYPEIDPRGTEWIDGSDFCYWGNGILIIIGVGTTAILMGVVAILATLSKNIPTAFSESKWIVNALYVMFVWGGIFLVGVVVGETQKKNPTYYLYSVVVCINCTMSSFMNFMFVPKFWNILIHKKLDVTDVTRKIKEKAAKRESHSSSSGGTHGGGGGGGGGVSAGKYQPATKSPTTSSSEKHNEKRNSAGTVEMKTLKGDSEVSSFNSSTMNPMAHIPEEASKSEKSKLESELRERVKYLEKKLGEEVAKNSKSSPLRRSGTKTGSMIFGTSIPDGSNWQEFFDDDGYAYWYHNLSQECTYIKPNSWF
jgi:uncharacterized membrane protein YgcG